MLAFGTTSATGLSPVGPAIEPIAPSPKKMATPATTIFALRLRPPHDVLILFMIDPSIARPGKARVERDDRSSDGEYLRAGPRM